MTAPAPTKRLPHPPPTARHHAAASGVLQRQRGREVADQPAVRLNRRDTFARQHHFCWPAIYPTLRISRWFPWPGMIEVISGEAKTGVIAGGNHDIAEQQLTACPPQREAVHGGNQQFGEGVDPRPQLGRMSFRVAAGLFPPFR